MARSRKLRRKQVRRCYCEGHCPNNQTNGTCEVKLGGLCFTDVEAYVENGEEYAVRRYGCLPPAEGSFMQCKGHLVPHQDSKSIECCNDSDFCNRNLKPMYAPRPTNDVPWNGSTTNLPYIVLLTSITFCLTVFLLAVALLFLRYKRKRVQNKFDPYATAHHGPHANLIDKSSGSGSGLPVLVQRTIAKQLDLVEMIAKGRYGQVWLAKWREDQQVAVKVFLTTEEESWLREMEIYQTVLMRHENILSFIAADIKAVKGWTQMFLITEYHERGSLYDYLQGHCLDPPALLTMARSIASGLTYLHTEILGTKGKPALAHRDIKSKNLLVKSDGECCLADFGLAVKYLSDSNEIDVPPNVRSGTRRYMAPELLDRSINPNVFEAYKMADMYSLGLVYWEMTRRCCSTDSKTVDDYAMPYQDCVPNDPSVEDMTQVVCVKRIRPEVPERWEKNDADVVVQTMAKIMRQLWHATPAVRLTALRVKKTLIKLEPDQNINVV